MNSHDDCQQPQNDRIAALLEMCHGGPDHVGGIAINLAPCLVDDEEPATARERASQMLMAMCLMVRRPQEERWVKIWGKEAKLTKRGVVEGG